jgi:aminomethyltransferase
MPLQYEGVIAEHNAVRNSVGIFDVTHLGKLRVSGPDAEDALQRTVTADVAALVPGKATYSLVLTEEGGCVDDVFVYRLGDESWLVVPNASNVDAVKASIEASGASASDAWDEWAILAVQGPDAFATFANAFPDSDAESLKLHEFAMIDVAGEQGLVARTGYTGERGYELYAPWATAADAWRLLTGAGARPVGLGARDTLRLEMGYALYGHEISLDVNPLEAGLGWVLAWDAPFRGKAALEEVRSKGAQRKLFGIVCRDKGVPRQGFSVFAGGAEVGTITSGNHSPTLGTGIALARGPVDTLPAVGDVVEVEARGRRIVGDIVKPPLLKRT